MSFRPARALGHFWEMWCRSAVSGNLQYVSPHLSHVTVSLTGACKTVGSRGQPCIFPFLYADESFDNEGWMVDQACPATKLHSFPEFECDDKYFSL